MPFHICSAQTTKSLRERSADSEKVYHRASGKDPVPVSLSRAGNDRWVRPMSKASLTVECAVALPFFFLCMIMLISFMDAVGLFTEKNLELSNKARQMAMYAGTLDSDGESAWIDIPWTVTYHYPVRCVPVPDLMIALRARVHPWTGYSGSEAKTEAAEKSDTHIYLTDNQEVYHTHADCTHLDLSVMRVPVSSVNRMRNTDGGRYKPCPGFPKEYSGDVYITSTGEYYYPSTQYGSLTRHVRIARLSDHRNLCICQRCAARDAA